jgi:hypothetical protein
MPSIPLDTAKVTLVDHGSGQGFGLLVDGRPLPNVMLLPAGTGGATAQRYHVIVGGVFSMTVPADEAMRWAAAFARWSETLNGTTNGHITNGGAKPRAIARTPRATAAKPAATAARRGPPASARK